MIKKFTITFILFFVASTAFADETGDKNKKSDIKPKTEVGSDSKSFKVNTLKACTGEFDQEDAISEFIEEEAAVRLMELIPLTEGLEESSASDHDEVTTSVSVIQP